MFKSIAGYVFDAEAYFQGLGVQLADAMIREARSGRDAVYRAWDEARGGWLNDERFGAFVHICNYIALAVVVVAVLAIASVMGLAMVLRFLWSEVRLSRAEAEEVQAVGQRRVVAAVAVVRWCVAELARLLDRLYGALSAQPRWVVLPAA
jgi:hypothetical protein